MNFSFPWRSVLIPLALLSSMQSVLGQSFDKPTLEKIREFGAIYIGHREASVPFSFIDGNEVKGYSMELCNRIADAVKAELGNPNLKVVLVPVTSSSRILMVRTGVIDLECGSTTNTKIRQQGVAFGVTTFVSGVKAVTRKDSGIERIADLDGKVVVTVGGTTTGRLVQTVLAKRNGTVQGKSAANYAESLAMVLAKQADAFVLDDALLSALLAASPEADKLKLLDENFGLEPYGIALRKDDPKFKKLVDATLIGLMKSGEMETLYNKWFMSSIPPKNINLQMPLSDRLKDLFRNPDDTGI